MVHLLTNMEQWKKDAIAHAKECKPEESCGILAIKNNQTIYYKCKNVADELKTESFIIEPIQYADIEDETDEIVGIVHSHPQNILVFSDADIYSCNSIDLPFYLVSPDSDKIETLLPNKIDAKKN